MSMAGGMLASIKNASGLPLDGMQPYLQHISMEF